jgi:hypothetical protein
MKKNRKGGVGTMKLTDIKLKVKLDLHLKWIKGENGGERANLSGADLSGADLSGAKIGDLLFLSELSDAINLAPLIWQEWQDSGFNAAKKRFGLYQVSGEDKALIAMCPLMIGGFCFVLHRREIWWWSWSCPHPDTVPVLWRENGG